jgi:lysophospholipase L1-like esterase
MKNEVARFLAVTAVVAATAAAGCSKSGSSPSPTQPSGTTKVVYTAIGASDAVGVGGSVPCLPFVACPDGTGYVPVLARRLGETRPVTTTNLGIPAAVLSPEIQQLGQQYGRTIPANFIQGEMPFVPRDTTLVTIFAGGNDANTIGTAVEGGSGGTNPTAYIDQQVRGFGDSLDILLRGIRDRAPGVRIVIANLPNLSGLPYASGLSVPRRQGLQRIAVGITRDVINKKAGGDVVVVDLMCDARSYDGGNYSSDGFHPNDTGYAFMADALNRAVQGVSSTPSSSCPQMELVPPL